LNFFHRFEPGQGRAVLALHGTGGNEDSLFDIARFVFPKSPILSPRGRSLDEGVPRFFRRLREGVFDEEDMAEKTRELALFVEGFLHGKELPPPYDLIGYSNGANMGLSLLFRRPELLGKLVLLRPMVPFEPDPGLDLSGNKVMLCAGRNDPIVFREESTRLEDLLVKHKADVRMLWSDGGHSLSRQELESAKRWVDG